MKRNTTYKNLQTGFDIGLDKLIEREFLIDKNEISVLSVGCGRSVFKITEEIKSFLTAFYNKKRSTVSLNYYGIDLELNDLDKIKSDIKNSFNNHPVTLNFIQGDVNNCMNENFFENRIFDIVILRHPQFFDTYGITSNKIIRTAIPYLLKENGLFIISLYTCEEAIFFENVEGKNKTLDPILLDILYEQKNKLINSCTSNTYFFEKNGIKGFNDQIMFKLKNRINTKNSSHTVYKINTDSLQSNKEKEYLKNYIISLGGK